MTADTAPLVKYLKADLQRIVDSANEELKGIRRAGWADSTRQAEESRVINEARAFAVRRVESTVRHLRNMKTKSPAAEYRPVTSIGRKWCRRHREHNAIQARPAAAGGASPDEPAPPPELRIAPRSPELPRSPRPTKAAPTAEPEFPRRNCLAGSPRRSSRSPQSPNQVCRADSRRTETAELTAPEPTYPFESDDTEVLAEIATVLQEIAPLAEAPVDHSPRHHQPVERPLAAPAAEPPSPPPDVPRPEPEIDDAETTRHQVPELVTRVGARTARTPAQVRCTARTGVALGYRHSRRRHHTAGHRSCPRLDTARNHAARRRPATGTGPAPRHRDGAARPDIVDGDLRPRRPAGLGDRLRRNGDLVAPRELPPVDDLGWILGEATHWRDGLPRMVHTLAKAGAAGNGHSRRRNRHIAGLPRYLAVPAFGAISRHRSRVAVELPAAGRHRRYGHQEPVNANYHFAWFQMLSAPWAGGLEGWTVITGSSRRSSRLCATQAP